MKPYPLVMLHTTTRPLLSRSTALLFWLLVHFVKLRIGRSLARSFARLPAPVLCMLTCSTAGSPPPLFLRRTCFQLLRYVHFVVCNMRCVGIHMLWLSILDCSNWLWCLPFDWWVNQKPVRVWDSHPFLSVMYGLVVMAHATSKFLPHFGACRQLSPPTKNTF